MAEHTYLHGVALKNYRGIGNEFIYIGPFEKFNFFIGANNSGKSSVLAFIAKHLTPLLSNYPRFQSQRENLIKLDHSDIRLGSSIGNVGMAIGIKKEKVIEALLNKMTSGSQMFYSQTEALNMLDKISINELIYINRIDNEGKLSIAFDPENPSGTKKQITSNEWRLTWQSIFNSTGGDEPQWINQTLEYLAKSIDISTPPISFIPAIRQISKKGDDFNDLSGKGLIEELAKLQNPGAFEREKFKLFESINEFLRSVINNDTATIEIPYNRDYILVKIDEKVLPLENLGTGIHEVVMIAAFCTIHKNQIICIEEPEIHLHPILQKRLIAYLDKNTSNQYFIATHSASLIDYRSGAVFNVHNTDGFTVVDPLQNNASKFNAIRDLGYKASDILQANSIIWVEGPSDRIYMNYWLNAVDPDLREGIHYSIMFYGGRLLSHLKANEYSEYEADALIELCKINRNFAIVIDSDRKTSGDPLNATKNRIIDELGKHGIAWVTSGREIENYVNKDAMTSALSSVYKTSFEKRQKTGQYDHVLPFKKLDGTTSAIIDKVAVAKHIATLPPDLSTLDLEFQINRIATMIREAN